MIVKLNNCQLEWDQARGVLYVHHEGRTALRVCGLPVPTADTSLATCLIDITRPERVSYQKDNT